MSSQSRTDFAYELAKIDTPTLSNAIEKLEVRNRVSGFTSRELRCLYPELPPVCGYAVTAQVSTFVPEKKGGLDERFVELCEAVAAIDGPTIVVFQETGPHADFSAHCGEIMATAFKQYGAVGLVSDSAVRDLKEVNALGFQYFAPGAVASHGTFRIERVQVPVTVCGLHVSPGDLLHGDTNGLISVPLKNRERLPSLAKERYEAEQKFMSLIKKGREGIADLRAHLTH